MVDINKYIMDKKIYISILLWCLFSMQLFAFQFEKNDKIVFIGNSITHGGSFHNVLRTFLATRYQKDLTIFNKGISGDVAQGVLDRLEEDILSEKPTVAFVMLGMNDVQRWAYVKNPSKDQIKAQENAIVDYKEKTALVIKKLQEHNIRIILLTPTIFDENLLIKRNNNIGVNEALGKCATYIKSLGKKHQLKVVDFYTILNQINKEQQEINAVRDKYFTQIEEAKKYNLDIKLLEEARLSEINDIEKKFEEEREEERAEARAKKMDAFNKRRDDRLKTIKENAERELEIEEQLEDAKFRVASQALDAISSIGKLFAGENEKNAKIAFKISKAVGIAQVGINTSQAIMKAAAETTDVTPTQSLRTANMIALGVAGAAQIASIAAQKFEGGSSTVPKPSMGGGSQAPAFNVVGASGETQLADAIGSQTQRPARAYVVSNDVTTAQEMDRNIIEGASIG